MLLIIWESNNGLKILRSELLGFIWKTLVYLNQNASGARRLLVKAMSVNQVCRTFYLFIFWNFNPKIWGCTCSAICWSIYRLTLALYRNFYVHPFIFAFKNQCTYLQKSIGAQYCTVISKSCKQRLCCGHKDCMTVWKLVNASN